MDLLYAIAAALMDFMDGRPPLLLTFGLLYVVGLPLILLHELGHALAALRLLGSRVDIVLGTHGPVGRVQLGRIALALKAWTPLAGVAGVAGTASFANGPMSDGVRSDGRLALDALRAMRMAPPRRERRRGGGPIAPGSRRARLQPVYAGS